MAYNKTPLVQTYETKRLSLVSNPLQRSGDATKDFRLLNMMVEVVKSPVGDQTKYFVKSRPGLAFAFSTQTGAGRGIHYWVVGGVGYCMAVVGNQVYSNGTSVLTLTTSTGTCGFTEYVDDTGAVKLILLDGTKGYVFTSPTAATTITDSNFPSPHIPMPIFLDGYLFVAKASTSDVYNSALNDPTRWTSSSGDNAGSYISAEMYPDLLVGLTRNNNYIYAVGSGSVEYFYDAANSTSSPLARHDSAVQQFGAVARDSIVQTEEEVILIGETAQGGHTVWTIDGFKAKEIGIPAVRSALVAEGSNISNIRAFVVRVAGQKCYVACLSTRTLVYSFDTQMWHEWGSNGAQFFGICGTAGPNSSAYILDATTGTIYTMDETVVTDNNTPINCQFTTQKLDFDTINRKMMYRLALIGDVPDPTNTDLAVSVQWSDNDYQTWTSARTLQMNTDLPAIYQLGFFRRRAFKISYTLPHLLRLEGLEVDINKGTV